jgi:hypothetical protein
VGIPLGELSSLGMRPMLPALSSMIKLSVIFTGEASTRLAPPFRDELLSCSVSLSAERGDRRHVGPWKVDANEVSNAPHALRKPRRDVVVVQRHIVHVDAVEQMGPASLARVHLCMQQRHSP